MYPFFSSAVIFSNVSRYASIVAVVCKACVLAGVKRNQTISTIKTSLSESMFRSLYFYLKLYMFKYQAHLILFCSLCSSHLIKNKVENPLVNNLVVLNFIQTYNHRIACNLFTGVAAHVHFQSMAVMIDYFGIPSTLVVDWRCILACFESFKTFLFHVVRVPPADML